MASRLLALAGVMSTAAAQFVTTAPMAEVPEWQVASEMILSVTAVDAGVVPLQYTVAPLTANLGLNQTDAVRNVRIRMRISRWRLRMSRPPVANKSGIAKRPRGNRLFSSRETCSSPT